MLPLQTSDTQAGIKAMSRALADEAFARQRCPGFFFDLEFFLTAQRQGHATLGLPVTLRLNSEKTTVRVLRESVLALYWMLRITWLNLTAHYGRKHSRETAPPSYYQGQPLGTRIFLWLRWWLTPYSDMAAEFPPRGRFLDLGCGHGLFSICLAREPGRQVTALDHDAERVRMAQAAVQRPSLRFGTVNLVHGVPALRNSDAAPGSPIAAGASRDDSYDGIALIDVLHYFPPAEQRRILETARAALAPGGRLIFREVDPGAGLISRLNRAYEWLATSTGFTRSEKKTELHFRSRTEWEQLLTDCGFTASSRRCSSLIFADVLFVGVNPALNASASISNGGAAK
jgi:SAM-dependent methyltransferase